MPQEYCIAFWNVENLFAPEGFGQREPWIAEEVGKDLQGWTQQLFERKLDQLAAGIVHMNGGRGPDLLGVCEVENAFVLDELIKVTSQALPNRQYTKVHHDSKDHRGIDTAFLYDAERLEVDPDAIFSHWIMRRTGTRDITQATFRTRAGGNEFVALVNHWPSRSGGAHESRGFRMTAGETLAYWHERIWEKKGKDTPVIALGDFNDDPFDESITYHARATRERDDLLRATSPKFFNLAWRFLDHAVPDSTGTPRRLHGTLYFDGNANVFDQILVSRGFLGKDSPLQVVEDTARIDAVPAMISRNKIPAPIRFGLPRGNPGKNVDPNGFSDHYPVSVMVHED